MDQVEMEIQWWPVASERADNYNGSWILLHRGLGRESALVNFYQTSAHAAACTWHWTIHTGK